MPGDKVTVPDKTRATGRSRTAGLIEKKRAAVKYGTGKRRLQGGKIPKRNKKYFQDIRNFATTLAENQVSRIKNGDNDNETSDSEHPVEEKPNVFTEDNRKKHSKLPGRNTTPQSDSLHKTTTTNKRSSLMDEDELTQDDVDKAQDGTQQGSDATKTNKTVIRSNSYDESVYS